MHRNHGVQMRREPWWYVETHATHKCGEPPLCSVHNQHMEEGSNIGGVHSSTYSDNTCTVSVIGCCMFTFLVHAVRGRYISTF